MKRIKVPPPATLEEAATTFAKAWCEWHNNADGTIPFDLADAGHGICKALGLMLNEDPDTGVWELVRR